MWSASPKFSALYFWFTRYRTLNDQWSLKLASAGQMASGPMYLSQKFYLGGHAFGRGYAPRRSAATTRWRARLELLSIKS